MKMVRIGIDLAKTVFQVHGVDAQEKPVCRRQLRRRQLLEFFTNRCSNATLAITLWT